MPDPSETTLLKRGGRFVPVWLGSIVGGLTLLVLYQQVFGPHTTDLGDIYDHLLVVQKISDGGPWNIYSLFFPLVYLLSFGHANILIISCVATVVLVTSVIAKGILSYSLIEKTAHSKPVASLISLGLILAMPLPNWWKPDEIYIDKIAPNVWSNATVILTMPFAILLFLSALRWVEAFTLKAFMWLTVFSLLSVLTKPNYVLAFFPVLGSVILIKTAVERSTETLRALLLYIVLVLVVSCVLYIQYLDTTTTGGWADPAASKEANHIILAPLAVWSLYSPNIPASFLLSVAFPLSVLALYFKEVRHDVRIAWAWATLGIATLQYALLAEAGKMFPDGNWGWASNIAMYILFLVSAAVLVSQPRSPRFYFVATVFGLHVLSGIYYYIRLALGVGYY